jgi:hypothetical protein
MSTSSFEEELQEKETVLLTRHDFIGEYLNETEQKVMTILGENRNKNIVIDLVKINDKDLYYDQAINAIKKFIEQFDTKITLLDENNPMSTILRELKTICVNNSLQDATTPEEIEQCSIMLNNSLEKNKDFIHHLDPSNLLQDYERQYDTLTQNMKSEEKEAFSFEVYTSIVESTKRILEHIKNGMN